MSPIARIKREGISLRTIHACMTAMALIASGLLIYATVHTLGSYQEFVSASTEYSEAQDAARELMDASDTLTEAAQRFTLAGNREYMDSYFREAFETRRREDAIERMARCTNNTAAQQELQEAMEESVALMDREYRAMRLVAEAQGCGDLPAELQAVVLTAEEEALSPADKMELARNLVLGEEYYEQKELIRGDMQESLHALVATADVARDDTNRHMLSDFRFMRVVILIEVVGTLFMVWLTTRLGIDPVLQAVENIKEDSPLPVIGANEFRYLAKTYNKMYEVYKNSVAHLNYKASHDELTGVYNRSGYDLLLSSLDMNSTYLLLIDVDHFKTINDTYGHALGDRMLRRIAQAIQNNFRSDDYVCRVGGDEFVVFMVHADPDQQRLVGVKVRAINEELAEPGEGLPAASVSVGIVHGSDCTTPEEMFHKADAAMYEAKNAGRKDFRFAAKK